MMPLMPMTMKRNPDKEVYCLGSAVDDEDADDDDDDNDADEHVNEDLGSCDG